MCKRKRVEFADGVIKYHISYLEMFNLRDNLKIKSYIDDKFLDLGRNSFSRTNIYLDTNFWVNIRDHLSGKNCSQEISDLLNYLRPRVKNGQLICTYSSYTFSELMKHLDKDVRLLTAQIIDELSNGICIANTDRLLENELSFLALKFANKQVDMHYLKERAWATPFFLLHDFIPPSHYADFEVEFEIQKKFIDEIWLMKMSEFVDQIHSSKDEIPVFDWPALAVKSINNDIKIYETENNGFFEIYISELNGLFDLYKERAAKIYVETLIRDNVNIVPKNHNEFNSCQSIIHNVVMNFAKNNGLKNYLPTMHIECAMHAMVRNDKRRKFKPNDLIDFRHAGIALTYCSFFLTDKPNAQLIKSAKLDIDFDCIICDNPSDARLEIDKYLSSKK